MVVMVVVEEAGNSIDSHRESHVEQFEEQNEEKNEERNEEKNATRSHPEGPCEMKMTVGMNEEEVGDSKKEPEDSMKLTDVEGG